MKPVYARLDIPGTSLVAPHSLFRIFRDGLGLPILPVMRMWGAQRKEDPTMDVRETLFRNQPASNERYWATIVSVYSGLDVTKPGDRLPALSGVASRVGEQFRSHYLAGL